MPYSAAAAECGYFSLRSPRPHLRSKLDSFITLFFTRNSLLGLGQY
jgi:hypothetical protein